MNYDIELKLITSKIDNFDVITFDIFDTLVLRNSFEPTDIFKIVQREYELSHGQLGFDFYDLRKRFEMDARIHKKHQEDIIFDDIYNEFRKHYPDDICTTLKTLELKIEKEFIVKNELMFEVYKYAIDSKKDVYFISDMYLPSTFLSEVLDDLGLKNYKRLYVSAEYLKTKHHGTLYQLVKEHNKLDITKWLHIGDNHYSDVVQAESQGISAYHYKKINERVKHRTIHSIEDSILTALEINQLYTRPALAYWNCLGYTKVARMFLLLTKWLINCIEENRTDIYFLARDGYFVKKAYDLYCNERAELPKSHYLYASRRAFQWVEILDNDIDEFLFIITGFNPQFSQKLTCREILRNLNISANDKVEVISKYNISLDTILCVDDGTLGNARKFLKEIIEEIKRSLNKEKEAMMQYLDEQGLNDENKNIALFDIGWRGSIHKSLQQFTKKEIFGYYLGTNQFVHSEIKNNSLGFVFDKGLPENNNTFISRYLMIFESLFTAPHGSLQYFEKNADGEVVPVLESADTNRYYTESITAIQEGYVNFIQTALQYDRFFQDCTSNIAIKNIKEMLLDEEFEDLYEFSFLHNSVGFGITDDLKNYVSIITSDEYSQSPNQAIAQSQFNLWPGALIIKKGDRLFTVKEYNAIYLNGNNNIYLPVAEPHQVYGNIEIQFAKKIYHYYRSHGIKLTLLRASKSLKYIYTLYKKGRT